MGNTIIIIIIMIIMLSNPQSYVRIKSDIKNETCKFL